MNPICLLHGKEMRYIKTGVVLAVMLEAYDGQIVGFYVADLYECPERGKMQGMEEQHRYYNGEGRQLSGLSKEMVDKNAVDGDEWKAWVRMYNEQLYKFQVYV